VPNDILQIYAGPNVTHDCYHDQHESFLTDQGTIITTAYNTTEADLTSVGGPANGWILDGMFHEIDVRTGEVLFTFKSTEHLDVNPFTASHQPLAGTGVNASIPWGESDYPDPTASTTNAPFKTTTTSTASSQS